MENLPLIVLRKIFDKLTNLNEIIRCSLVCKNWRSAYETIYKPELLCLYTNNFVPLNKKLEFINGKVTKYNLFHFTNVKFIDSEITRIHFANIKKLIVSKYGMWPREKFGEPENSLQSQINHFKNLEYLEINECYFFKSKGKERLNLPNLKVLIFYGDIQQKKNQIVLNTPSLEVLTTDSLDQFNFLFPQQLRYLTANTISEIQNDFVNLKCLRIFTQELYKLINKYNEFLKKLPNLKFIFLRYSLYKDETNFKGKLESQKWKYNLNDLKVIEYEGLFDYTNWRNYIEPKGQIHQWPYGFSVDFSELINFKVPFNYFEENYLPIGCLKIDNVPDQSQLVAFLKKLYFSDSQLIFSYGCNLDQYFFDEIPSYLSIDCIDFYGDLFYRLTNYTFLSKLNFRVIYLNFHQLPYQVVWNILKNPSVHTFHFFKFEQYSDFQTDRDKDYYCDLKCHFCKNEYSNYGDLDSEDILINRKEDVIRHLEMRLKTKFT